MNSSPSEHPPSAPRLVVSGAVATITLNRPAHRNRLENRDLRTLMQHFAEVDANTDIRVLVINANTAGQPRPVFCAGYDMSGFSEDKQASTAFEQVPDALARLRPITICALNGSVYGGATDLFLACDLRVALQGIELRMPATALGLHYYPSGLQRYVSRLGVSAAKRAFLTARPFGSEQLWHTGCLEALASPMEFETVVEQLVKDVCALAPLAVQATKQSLNEISTGQYHPDTLRARESMTAHSADFAEGRRAFAERRPPVFHGR